MSPHVTEEEWRAFIKERYDQGEVAREYGRVLWATDWYDGPMAGVMFWDGKLVYFDCFDDGAYAIYELSENEQRKELDSYYSFRCLYGDHYDYDLYKFEFEYLFYMLDISPKIRTEGEYKQDFPSLVGEHPFNCNYRKNKIIGWFRW